MSPGSHISLNQKVRNETKSGKWGRAGRGCREDKTQRAAWETEHENQREEETGEETRKARRSQRDVVRAQCSPGLPASGRASGVAECAVSAWGGQRSQPFSEQSLACLRTSRGHRRSGTGRASGVDLTCLTGSPLSFLLTSLPNVPQTRTRPGSASDQGWALPRLLTLPGP